MPPKTKIEDKYVKMDHHEHVLARPGMYIGSIEPDTYNTWVFNETSNSMEKREISIVPGLYKIFDEILVNAIDHVSRMKQLKEKDDSAQLVKNIKVTIDKESGELSVWNDGDGIDVEMHPEHKIYIPELIFGHLLTSTNYNDEEERTIGGQNGLGSKVSSIFSSSFHLETVDARNKKVYSQTWTNNMKEKTKPSVRSASKKPYTHITFTPDYKRFNLKGLSDDMYAMFVKRVYDICAVTESDVNVYLNGQKLEFKTFEKYVDLFIGSKDTKGRVYEKINDRWEILATSTDELGFDQISFVNGIWTIRGGKHVDYISNQIANGLADILNKKKKGSEIKATHIKNHLMVFIKSTITNPTFDSQTKDLLTTPMSKFGSKAELSEKFFDKLMKTDIVEKALSLADVGNMKAMKKTDGKKSGKLRGMVKLDDANYAGTSKSAQCTLILTEGDSAKATALAGISEIGRDYYGVFPLKGKLMNVKDVGIKKLLENEEIQAIKKILGLESGKTYKSLDELRYGRIMLMTDQDSVSGDTPLLLRNPETNEIVIKHIDDIVNMNEWTHEINGKDYGSTNYEVWTEKGWTNIIHVMRHKTTKRMFRILTHTGIVDVTEDHSLLNKNAEKIRPIDCKIGQELLHSFPILSNDITIPEESSIENMNYSELCKLASKCRIQYYQTKRKQELINEIKELKQTFTAQKITVFNNDFKLSNDESWVMGLFWADGTCGIYNWQHQYKQENRHRAYTSNRTSYSWSITNTNKVYLEKAKAIMEKYYNYRFTIIEVSSNPHNQNSQQCYKLVANGNSAIENLIKKYIDLFYYKNDYTKYQNGNKYISPYILNSSEDIRKAFFEGYYNGDGFSHDINNNGKGMDIESKISAQSIYTLCKSLGYLVSINHQSNKHGVYTLTITKGHQQDNPCRIKKIIDLGVTTQYVYDLETENHHFQAGVGQMIVHNTDGTHIRGLLMNFFETLWPSLMDKGFIASILTPIIKVTHNTSKQKISFYNYCDYEAWTKETGSATKYWTIKYYKGLGTSNEDEAKSYFKNMRLVNYLCNDRECNAALDLAFNKKRADDRKVWLGTYDPEVCVNYDKDVTKVTYKNFIDRELIHFSVYDVKRSIPSMVDGLKPSQRKILFACFKRNLVKETKVAQLAGYVSENAAYHHGEASLQGAIINMAQNFVGSNNLNILLPNGQMGTRLLGGKDAAAPRYIFTELNPLTMQVFKKEDERILKYLDDDGLSVEPDYYLPIIPLILVNGSVGIGTGFSTNVPSYNPIDIVNACKNMIKSGGKCKDKLIPWTRGFKGTIMPTDETNTTFTCSGVYNFIGEKSVEISELPIGTWTEDYKAFLEEYLEKNPKVMKDYESHYTTQEVKFILHFSEPAKSVFNEKDFKLQTKINTSNMHLFGADNIIKKYESVHEIMEDFYIIRVKSYTKRKEEMIKVMKEDMMEADAKRRFIEYVIAKKIPILGIKKAELEKMLEKFEFHKIDDSFNYLLNMPIQSLTAERAEALNKEVKGLEAKIKEYEGLTVADMWNQELDQFAKLYNEDMVKYLEYMKSSKSASKDGKKSKK